MKQHYTGGGHIAVKTCNMEESIAFYEKIGGRLLQLESLPDGSGRKQLALLSLAGFVLELICPAEPKKEEDGVVAHFAVYVDDVDAAAAELQSLGINTFLKPEKTVLPELFGGLENRFFRGPSGEQIELLHCNTFAYPD